MKGENAMSEALLLVAEGYEQIAAGIRKMVAAQKDTPKKEEKPVKKAEKKETPVADTPKEEAAPKETAVDRKTVRAFLADKSRSGKTSEVKNLIEQFGFQKLCRNRRTVDLDKRHVISFACSIDGISDQFFTGSGVDGLIAAIVVHKKYAQVGEVVYIEKFT